MKTKRVVFNEKKVLTEYVLKNANYNSKEIEQLSDTELRIIAQVLKSEKKNKKEYKTYQ